MRPADLRECIAFWQLGLIDPDHLRDVAYEAIEGDLDCQELRQIAGDSRLESDEARELLARALRTLGVEPPSDEAARRIVCLSVARSILAGAIDPIWGANFIADKSPEEEHGPDLVGPLIYYSCDCCNGLDEMADPLAREKRMAECREAIRVHVRKILPYLEEKAGVRRGEGETPSEGPGFLGWNHGPIAGWPMGGDLKKASRSLEEGIREILLRTWDPIGVSHSRDAKDEYDCCIPQVTRLLLTGAPKAALVEYLREQAGEHMGLEESEQQARNNEVAAQRLFELVAPPGSSREDAPG